MNANAARDPSRQPMVAQTATAGNSNRSVCWIGISASRNGRYGALRKAASPQRSGRHESFFAVIVAALAI
jgi:hypothetical protein